MAAPFASIVLVESHHVAVGGFAFFTCSSTFSFFNSTMGMSSSCAVDERSRADQLQAMGDVIQTCITDYRSSIYIYYALLYCIVLDYTILYHIISYHIIFCHIILNYIILYYITLYYIILYHHTIYIVLYHIIILSILYILLLQIIMV